MKLIKGDEVKVIKGKDKGKTAKVLSIFPKEQKVLIEGVNQYKRHVKKRMPAQKSEIITLTKPLSIANIVLICPKCKKPTRVGYTFENNEKVRVCKKCHKQI